MNTLELNKALEPFRDIRGAIVQRDGDGGDSAYRTALFICLIYLSGNKKKAGFEWDLWLKNFCVSPGLFRRHWDEKKWYSNPNNFSRDQFEKSFLAMLMLDWRMTLATVFRQFVFRLGFHQNIHKGCDCEGLNCYKIPDIIGVGEIRNLIRTFFFPYWAIWFIACINVPCGFVIAAIAPYALLCALDLAFLADLYFRKKQTWDYDSLMAVDLAYAQKRTPTPVSNWAAKEYLKTDWKERILHNYSATNNDIKPLGEFYIEVVEKILTKGKA